MTTWRDETSDETQADLDDLLDLALRTAKEQLDVGGRVLPVRGRAHRRAARPPSSSRSCPDRKGVADVVEVYELCWQALAADAADLRAVAVVTNVGGGDGDAIAVALEHREGVAIEVFLPYVTQGKVNGKKPAQKHRFGDLQAIEGTVRVWS